jgi:hypothetical protein
MAVQVMEVATNGPATTFAFVLGCSLNDKNLKIKKKKRKKSHTFYQPE